MLDCLILGQLIQGEVMSLIMFLEVYNYIKMSLHSKITHFGLIKIFLATFSAKIW